MAVITLTTDFGEKDYFAGAVKGLLNKELDGTMVVDISHRVSPFNIQEAAYIIRNAYKNFPEGSIHIIGIDTELTPEQKHIAMYLDGHYFIGADNGIFSLIASDVTPEKMVEIDLPNTIIASFPTLEIFAKAACHIARGGMLDVIGKRIDQYKEIKPLLPVINTEQSKITGHVIYIDNYGNVVTNISQKIFNTVGKGRAFELFARNYIFNTIYNRYSEAVNFDIEKRMRDDDGKKLALFNAAGYIELAIYKSNLDTVGGASTLLGLYYRDTVTVQFR